MARLTILRLSTSHTNLIQNRCKQSTLRMKNTIILIFTLIINFSLIGQTANKSEGDYIGISKSPIAPDCDSNLNNIELNKCFMSFISTYINSNFNWKLLKKSDFINGEFRTSALFTLNESGDVKNVKVNYKRRVIRNEIKRIFKTIPQITPGFNNGKYVNLRFSLPIAFKVEQS